MTRTDQDAVTRCLAGDTEAFTTLVERYGGRVYNIALRITSDADAAKDCAQEAFIRAYRALHRYDPTLPFGPWLFRITTNASLNYVQRWHAHQTTVDELPDAPEEADEGPEETAVRHEELAERSSRRWPTSLPPTGQRSHFGTCSSSPTRRWRTPSTSRSAP